VQHSTICWAAHSADEGQKPAGEDTIMSHSSISRRDIVLAAGGVAVVAATTSSASAQTTVAGLGMPNEPLGGQPPAGSSPSVADFDYQIKYQA
jgi:hypothetical protein